MNESDIDELINLLLRSQQLRTRDALCLSIGIDPKQLSFLRDSSDSDFFLLLIKRLNDIGDREALCKLCCKELFPVFRKGKYGDILSDIAGKLNCSQEFRQNCPNNNQPISPPSSPAPEFSVNFPPQSPFPRIAHHKNKLFAVATILMFGLVGLGYAAYESFNQASQLVQDKNLTNNARLILSESEGNIGEYPSGKILVKTLNVKLRNYTVQAQFNNPYDGAINNWAYGFAFHENTSQKNHLFDVWVDYKEKKWHVYSNTRDLEGNLPNLNVSDNGSNKLRLTVKGKTALFFVNDRYIETFDFSDFTNKGDVWLISLTTSV